MEILNEIEVKTIQAQLKEYSPFEIKTFVDLMSSYGLIYKVEGAFAIFLRLTDKTLKDIMLNEKLLTEPTYLAKLFTEEGPNIHFIGLYGSGIRGIFKGLKKATLDLNPKSVSWYSEDMKNFTYRSIKCQQ